MNTLTRIETHVFNVSPKTNWVFIAVTDSDGAVGWGEASLIGWEPMLVAAAAHLAPDWLGLSLDDAATQLRVSPQSPGGLVGNTVTSAVLQAVASLLVQARGVQPTSVLGPLQRTQVTLYANINRATRLRTPDGFVATARRAQAQGFSAFKAAPFDGLTPALCATPDGQARIRHGVDCMLALRKALGPDARLMMDCHWRFDEAHALQALQALAPARLHWFECPIAETHAHWAATRRLRAAANAQGVLLAAAETQVGLAAFQSLFDEGLYDVVMPDVKYCGGPWEMLRIAERAAAQGVQFSPHNPSGPVCSWHSLLVAAVAPVCDMLEIQFDESPLYDALQAGPSLRMEDGHLRVPAQAGSVPGVQPALLAAHPYKAVPPGIETLLTR
jgi:galactonate dehydratase